MKKTLFSITLLGLITSGVVLAEDRGGPGWWYQTPTTISAKIGHDYGNHSHITGGASFINFGNTLHHFYLKQITPHLPLSEINPLINR